jgi:hypothetical protein
MPTISNHTLFSSHSYDCLGLFSSSAKKQTKIRTQSSLLDAKNVKATKFNEAEIKSTFDKIDFQNPGSQPVDMVAIGNRFLDCTNPLLLALSAAFSNVALLGPVDISVQEGFDIANLLKYFPFIFNSKLDEIQSDRHDYDEHAARVRQSQIAINIASNLLRIPAAGLTVASEITPALQVGGITTLTTTLGIAASALTVIAGSIGIYYFSYRIHQANQHAQALQRWFKELKVYWDMLNAIEQWTHSPNLRDLKMKLKASLHSLEATTEYKDAWCQLIDGADSGTEEKSELFQRVQQAILQVAHYISSETLAYDNKNSELQNAIQQEPKLQTLKHVISQDPKLANQKLTYTKLASCKATNNMQKFKQTLGHCQKQTHLDKRKKHLEAKRSTFWLSMTGISLLAGATFFALNILSLTSIAIPPLVPLVLTLAVTYLAVVMAICIYHYYDRAAVANNELAKEQASLDAKHNSLLNNIEPQAELFVDEKSPSAELSVSETTEPFLLDETYDSDEPQRGSEPYDSDKSSQNCHFSPN